VRERIPGRSPPVDKAMAKRIVLTVTTPLGYQVVLTRSRWREIVRFKHPAAAGHEAMVRSCLESPDEIRSSTKEAKVHIYYLRVKRRFLCTVVAPGDQDRRFVVTVYWTKRMKEGGEVWTK